MPRKRTTPTKSRTAQKIELLQNLINHPRTEAEEREAAQRMLKRVIEKARDNGEEVTDTHTARKPGGYRLPEVVYGDKYEQVKGMRLQDIAKLMRADIKMARKVGAKSSAPGALATVDPLGDMPKEIKVSVTSEYFSGGGAIRMRVKNVPREWGFVRKRDPWGDMRWVPSDAFEAVLTDLKVIHQAYNYDGSDSQVDYFHVNYYGSVDYDRPAPQQDTTPEGPVTEAPEEDTAQPQDQTTTLRPPQRLSEARIEAAAHAAGMQDVRPVHEDGELIGYTAQSRHGLYAALMPTGRILRLNHRSRHTVALWLQRNPVRTTTSSTRPNRSKSAAPGGTPTASGLLMFAYTEAERTTHIADLKTAAADEPDHVRYAARLISHYEPGGTLADEPDHEDLMGVSLRIGAALSNDIQAIYRRTSPADPAAKQRRYRADYRRVRNEDRLSRSRRSGRALQPTTTTSQP
ncbi:hypothetical protein OG730_41650 (plasmid) [Streptomyces sp. NBC_01298]|uniref:hypothetical protein n=1 Tax=Streptomyces sp. NBC_01298 TaxID=2903817 RepID=UPI002E1119AA|nr:hypothetical protein OG730_41650 [Streptomyces sp. NBC_01298]